MLGSASHDYRALTASTLLNIAKSMFREVYGAICRCEIDDIAGLKRLEKRIRKTTEINQAYYEQPFKKIFLLYFDKDQNPCIIMYKDLFSSTVPLEENF